MDHSCSQGFHFMTIVCASPLAQFASYQSEIESAVLKVLRSNSYVLGPEVASLECEFAQYIGVNFAIGVANGTDAIELALRALGVGPGDEVITVSHTAVATVAAIEAVGATPVLVDVEPDFYTIDPLLIIDLITNQTKAVIAVHLYGQPADIETIDLLCKANNLYLIEDVSQAHGAKFNGKLLGSFGDISCFSCYPTKNLGAIGDAGLIATNSFELKTKIHMLREYGWRHRYVSDISGRNSRLDEVQAAILRIKLRYLDIDNQRRIRHAALYKELLEGTGLILPKIRPNATHVFHLYVLRVDSRNKLIEFLKKRQIQCGVHYPMPIHFQPAYAGRIRAVKMGVTEALANEVLSLPMFPELEDDQIQQVARAIKDFFENES